MANYNLSTKAQQDLIAIYKYGIKFFGQSPATSYLQELENFLLELSDRPSLAKNASPIANGLKFYNFKAHVIFYQFENKNEIYVLRVLGKRMNFVEHL